MQLDNNDNNSDDTNQNKYTYSITTNQTYICYIDENDRRPVDSLRRSNVSKWRHALRGQGYVQVSLLSGLARN